MTGTLFVVATPIGNLGDMTMRSIEVLKSADLVLCEDTRVTKHLLTTYDIETPVVSYHQHSTESRISEIQQWLAEGKQLALVSDAGTPGISDPGNELIQAIVNAGIACTITPIPGASAAISALSISGFQTDKFIFLGFPPHKKRRQQFFQYISDAEFTTIFYESNHRIGKALQTLADLLDSNRSICVCRELTKKFETIYRGSAQDILKNQISEKGEFVIVVEKKIKEKQ